MSFDDLITLGDAAKALGLSAVTLRAARSRGRFAATKLGTTWVTTRQEVERYRRDQLDQRGRPLESAAIPWPGNHAGHPRLFVAFESLSTPARRRLIEEITQILASGTILYLADLHARLVASDPGHAWEIEYEPFGSTIAFRQR